MSDIPVDGTTSLSAQESTISFEEQRRFKKLTGYRKDGASATPQNVATFEDDTAMAPIPLLQFVTVPRGQSVGTLAPPGTNLVFDSPEIYVKGKLIHVAGFR